MFGLDDALKHYGFEETRSSVGCDMSDEGPKGGELGEDPCGAIKILSRSALCREVGNHIVLRTEWLDGL